MLAAEMTAHFVAAPALRVGDLAVFTDYAGRSIGCRVRRMFAAGEIASSAQVEVSICGLSVPAPYTIGATFTLDASKVKGAI